MSTVPKDILHQLVDTLSDDDAAMLYAVLQRQRSAAEVHTPSPRPLRRADIILDKPVLPEDETADMMINTVRLWRREAGSA